MKIKFTPNMLQKNSHTKVLITGNVKSHYVFIKDFKRLMFSTTKQRQKTFLHALLTKFYY